MTNKQRELQICFQVGDRVAISYVPIAVINVSVGMIGTVIKSPEIIAGMVRVEIRLDSGRELNWLQDNLAPLPSHPSKKLNQLILEPKSAKTGEPTQPTFTLSGESQSPVTIDVAAVAIECLSGRKLDKERSTQPEVSARTLADIQIDPEFKSLIPPLRDEERSQLEASLCIEGCRDRLVIWKEHNILLDGHNRYAICTSLGIGFDVVEVELPNREAAINWIIDLQLGRRNLTPEAISYLRGKKYNQEKQQGKRTDLTSGKSCPKLETAEKLARDYKISPRTIKNDARFAADVDTLAEVVGDRIRTGLLSRHAKLTKKQTSYLATLALESPKIVKEAFSGEKVDILDIVEIIKRACDERANRLFPFRIGEVCMILPQGDKELRQYSCCWGIVKEIYEFSCLVTVWTGQELILAEKNLKSLEYTEQEQAEKKAISLRLQKIIKAGGIEEPMIRTLMNFLGELERSYLRETEEGMLSWVEQKLNLNG